MFLAPLDDDEKDAFLALAASLASPAGLSVYQLPLWEEWLREMRLPERTKIGWTDTTVAINLFRTRQHKTWAMLELARLAANAEQPATLAIFQTIGVQLGFAPGDIVAFQDWAQRHATLIAETAFIAKSLT